MNWTNFVAVFEKASDVSADYLKERIRIWRNNELTATDWTQLLDSNVDKDVFVTYRQELRNLPQQDNDPRKWVFPVKPA